MERRVEKNSVSLTGQYRAQIEGTKGATGLPQRDLSSPSMLRKKFSLNRLRLSIKRCDVFESDDPLIASGILELLRTSANLDSLHRMTSRSLRVAVVTSRFHSLTDLWAKSPQPGSMSANAC